MHRFEVWAPIPEQVELVLGDERLAMERDDHGWWRADVDTAGPGTRYGFALNGGPALPDPRSMSQPEGIAGPSEVVDHGAFEWTDQDWGGRDLPGTVIYELHVGTFSREGTFDGVIEHLPHLVELGVDAVELLPVAEFSGERGWGYDGVDLYAPHHAYGGPEALKRLVDACHANGLAVVLDVVYNHLGPVGNHLAEYGPYFSHRHSTPWGEAVNVDGPGSDEVRRFIVDNALMWLRDHHFDGLRLDAVDTILDQSALHILEQLASEVDMLATTIGKRLFVVAENDTNDPRLARSRDIGGYGLAGTWADDWHHAVHAALTGESSGYYQDFVDETSLPKALRQAWVNDGTWSAFRQRTRGRAPCGLAPHQLVVCAQNHDQVGNRAKGERSAALMSEGRLRIAAALLLTSPFTPMLFQGEEWAASSPFQYFTDHQTEELARAVREGRRAEFAPFGWAPDEVPDPQDPATFERSRLDWTELDEPEHERPLDWYRSLISLRREHPALTDPSVGVEAERCDDVLTVTRGPLRLVANLGTDDHPVDLPLDAEILVASPGTPAPDDLPSAEPRPADAGAGAPSGGSVRTLLLPVDSVVIWHEAAR